MVRWTEVKSYEEALIALGNGNNAIRVSSIYKGNERSFSIFTEALVGNGPCTHLSLDGNNIGPEGAKDIAKALEENNSLTELDLRFNDIGDEGAKAVAEALNINTSLTELDFSGNWIGAEGAKGIADALKKKTTLTSLNLGFSIGSNSAKIISDALRVKTGLTKLVVGDIGDTGAKEIAGVLKVNTTLTSLRIGASASDSTFWCIGPRGIREIIDGLQANTCLTSLDLSGNKIWLEGAILLANELKVNKLLTSLYLDRNLIEDIAANKLAECIRQNNESALTYLSLNENDISDDGKLPLLELERDRPDLSISIVDKDEVESARQVLAQEVIGEKLPYGWCKLMVIGEGEAGKTQTIRSLLGEEFQSDHRSTAGGKIQFIHADSWFTKIQDQVRKDRNDMLLREAAAQASTKRDKSVRKEKISLKNAERPRSLVKTGVRAQDRKHISENPIENLVEEATNVLGRKSLSRNMRFQLENKHRLYFTMWDFAGQNVYKAVHHLFLTDGGLHLLVFNMLSLVTETTKERSLQDLTFWVKSVTMYSKNPQIVFVGTHLDQCSEGDIDKVNKIVMETVRREYRDAKANSKGLFYYPVVNCNEGRTEETFAEIRAELVQRAQRLDSVTQEVSMKWVLFFSSLWDRQAKKRCHYLPLQEMKEWLHEFNIVGREAEKLLEFCHRMGMILHWNNVEILKETVILNPQYIIDAAARIMHNEELHKEKVLKHKENLSIGMQDAYEEMHTIGFISSELLRAVLWSDGAFRSNAFFLQELFKVALLMCEYDKREKRRKTKTIFHEGYVVPSLLMNLQENEATHLAMKAVNQWEETKDGFVRDGIASVVESKLVFDWLPQGFFERLTCVCIKVGKLKRNILARDTVLFFVEVPIGAVPVLLHHEQDEIRIKTLAGSNVPALNVSLDVKDTAEAILGEEMHCNLKECVALLVGKDSHEFELMTVNDVTEKTRRVMDTNDISVSVKFLGDWYGELLKRREEVERGPRFVYKDIKGQLTPEEFDSKLKSKKSEFKEKKEAYEEARGSLDSLESVVGALNALMNGPVKLIASIWQDAMKHKSEDKDRTLYFYSNKVSLFLNDPDLRPLQKIETWIKEMCHVLDNFECPEHRFGLFLSHQGIKRDEDNYKFRYRKDKMYGVYRFFQERLRMKEDAEVPIFFDTETLISGDPQIEWMLFSAFYSDKVLLFIDKDYFKKKWCLMEYFLALHGKGSVHPFLLDFNRDCVPIPLPNKVVPKGIEKCKSENFVNSLNKHFGTKSRSEYTDRYNTEIYEIKEIET